MSEKPDITNSSQDKDIPRIEQYLSSISEQEQLLFLENYFYEIPCFIKNTRFLDNISKWKQNLVLQVRVMKKYCPLIYNDTLVSKINQTSDIEAIELLLELELKKIFNYSTEELWKISEKNFKSFQNLKYYKYYLEYFLNIPKFTNSLDENSEKLNSWLLGLNSTENAYFLRAYFETVPLFRENFSRHLRNLSLDNWKENVGYILIEEPSFSKKEDISLGKENEDILDLALCEIRRIKDFLNFENLTQINFQLVKRVKYYRYGLELCVDFYKENIMRLSTDTVPRTPTLPSLSNVHISTENIPVEFVYKKYNEFPLKKTNSKNRKKKY